MVTHIVFFKLKEATPQGIDDAKSMLLSMQGKIDLLNYLEVGVDVIRSERSYDLALVTRFSSLEDLQAYQVHPYHADVVLPFMRGCSASVVAVDYLS